MDELIPHPSALIESMRSIGYRPHTAIADLVDNSITAEARSVQLEISPAEGAMSGWIRIDDDGLGMNADELFQAMRWGGSGPKVKRDHRDLGRFGLGMKTASFSLGRRLTVVSRKDGETTTLRWDLEHIEKTGKWKLQKGVDQRDREFLQHSPLKSRKRSSNSGTTILITDLDKLRTDAHSEQHRHSNHTSLLRSVREHLGLVFHRFIDCGQLDLKLGAGKIFGWNLFGGIEHADELRWMKSSETFQRSAVKVRTYILPHHKNLTEEQYAKLGGPLGWNAHQGFVVYRANRLIVPGGWLGFARPEEHCKLARIEVDLPNNLDEAWGLNVMKSKVSPPALLKGDLERIANAARRAAMEACRFHGEKVAPPVETPSEVVPQEAFWKQISGKHDVRFRINRGHPLVEALVQSVSDTSFAGAFLHAFERSLPVSAILQQPHKTTHGLAADPDADELKQLATAARCSVAVLIKSGFSEQEAIAATLSCHPFSSYPEMLKPLLDN